MNRTNQVLVGLIAALAVAAFVVARRAPDPVTVLHPFSFDAEMAVGFELENRHGRFEFSREVDGEWTLVSPISYPANHLKLAVMIQSLEVVRTPEPLPFAATPAEELERAGLAADAARVVVRTAVGAEISGRIGLPRKVGGQAAASADGRHGVFGFASRIAVLFHQPLDEYRSPRALHFDETEWSAIRFERAGFVLTVEEREPGGPWLITTPRIAAPARRWMAIVLDRLPRLRVLGWLAKGQIAPGDAFAPASLRTITASLEHGGRGQEITLEVGAARDETTSWARRRGEPGSFWVGSRAVDSIFPGTIGQATSGR